MVTQIERSFALGWHVAELFHEPIHEGPVGPGSFDDRLPGVSNLIPAERSILLVRQITSDLAALKLTPEPGHTSPTTTTLEQLLRTEPRHRDTIRKTIWDMHVDILEVLTVADFQLGKAYSLGRALGESSIVPLRAESAQRMAALKQLFGNGRVLELGKWLTELNSDFGPNAGYAVSGSLDRWQQWVATPNANLNGDDVGKSLERQGDIWRSLLSGESQASDLLSASGYVDGAIALLRRIGQLTGKFLWSRAGALLLLVVALVIAAIFGISVLSSLSHSNKLAADLVTGLAALGLTTKGVMGSLGKIVAKSEGPLWDSEVGESCAVAATRLPSAAPKVQRRDFSKIGLMT